MHNNALKKGKVDPRNIISEIGGYVWLCLFPHYVEKIPFFNSVARLQCEVNIGICTVNSRNR